MMKKLVDDEDDGSEPAGIVVRRWMEVILEDKAHAECNSAGRYRLTSKRDGSILYALPSGERAKGGWRHEVVRAEHSTDA